MGSSTTLAALELGAFKAAGGWVPATIASRTWTGSAWTA